MAAQPAMFEELRFTARDGLSLYARRYRARGVLSAVHLRPVLCLAGLTRNARDFHDLAFALSGGAAPRDVYTLDARGRGLSDHDPDWKNYTVPSEASDVIDFIAAHGLAGAGIVGTSRGGLIAMVIAALQPAALGPVVLNDIGPLIEHDGLKRIIGYVGNTPVPATWADAAAAIKSFSRAAFPVVPDHQWEEVARQLFNEIDGRPAAGYDANLGKAMPPAETPPPQLWPQFEALTLVPVLVLRGGNSDILSQATVDEMRRRHSRLEAITVAGQGHAPLLKDAVSIGAIAAFLARHERVHEHEPTG